jgi:hypothetical protein
MAAMIILNKKRARRAKLASSPDDPSVDSTLLPPQPWEADLVLRVLSGGRSRRHSNFAHFSIALLCTDERFLRHWQSRRVVLTREVMAFAYVGDNNMLDYVPLCEITGIENLDHDIDHRGASNVLFEKAVSVSHALQIQTVAEGHNSGRKYFLQADTDTQRNQLVAELKRLVRRASTELISSFKRKKMRVRKIYNSDYVQSFAALLILMVRSAYHDSDQPRPPPNRH